MYFTCKGNLPKYQSNYKSFYAVRQWQCNDNELYHNILNRTIRTVKSVMNETTPLHGNKTSAYNIPFVLKLIIFFYNCILVLDL